MVSHKGTSGASGASRHRRDFVVNGHLLRPTRRLLMGVLTRLRGRLRLFSFPLLRPYVVSAQGGIFHSTFRHSQVQPEHL